MPKSAKMPFFSWISGISQLCHDERMASQCRLDPGFSANLRKVRLRLTLNSEVLTPSQWLVLYLRVKAKNRPTLGQMSFFFLFLFFFFFFARTMQVLGDFRRKATMTIHCSNLHHWRLGSYHFLFPIRHGRTAGAQFLFITHTHTHTPFLFLFFYL